jgi:hypothetical protein
MFKKHKNDFLNAFNLFFKKKKPQFKSLDRHVIRVF